MSLTLALPTTFTIPPVYLRTTEEENAAILLLGVSLLEKLKSDGYTSRMKELITKLEEETSTNQKFRQSMSLLNGCVEEAVGRSLSNLGKEIEALSGSIIEKDREERASQLVFITREREISERRSQEFLSLMERTVPRTPQLKGRTNEINSERLITETFATPGSGFVLHQRENFSGDHIFDWNGLRIMWEDKNYASSIPKAQVDKGLRDFEANQDCHVLIFASAHTPIVGYESSSELVSEIKGNRLLLFISSFKERPDLNNYIKVVIQPIIIGLKPLLLEEEREVDGSEEKLRLITSILTQLSQSLYDQGKALDSFISDMKIRAETMKNALLRTKHGLDKIINDTNGAPPAVEVVRQRKCGKCGQYGHIRSKCPT